MLFLVSRDFACRRHWVGLGDRLRRAAAAGESADSSPLALQRLQELRATQLASRANWSHPRRLLTGTCGESQGRERLRCRLPAEPRDHAAGQSSRRRDRGASCISRPGLTFRRSCRRRGNAFQVLVFVRVALFCDMRFWHNLRPV